MDSGKHSETDSAYSRELMFNMVELKLREEENLLRSGLAPSVLTSKRAGRL